MGPLPSSAPRPERASARFLPYIHSFRAVAIVAVVLSHFDYQWDDHGFGERLVLSLSRNASVLFLFVAGFLFQYLSENFSFGRYLKSKLLNVIVPYVLTSQPALVHQYYRHYRIFAVGFPRHFKNPILHAGWALLTAAHVPSPLWFIPMISILYLAAPFLIAMDRHPRWYWIIAPWLVVAMFCHRPMPLTHIGQALIYFTPAYLAGMCFSHYRKPIMAFMEEHLWTLFMIWAGIEIFDVAILAHSGAIFSSGPFSTENGVLDLNLPDKILLSFCLVGLLARYQGKVGPRLDYLAGASFGVFFVHRYIMELISSEWVRLFHHEPPSNLGSILFLVPLYVMGSLALIAIVRAVSGKYSRYLIGC